MEMCAWLLEKNWLLDRRVRGGGGMKSVHVKRQKRGKNRRVCPPTRSHRGKQQGNNTAVITWGEQKHSGRNGQRERHASRKGELFSRSLL